MKQVMIFVILLFYILLFTQVYAKTYGPTAKKETLWHIAIRMRQQITIEEKISVQQVMFALFHLNPSAFASDNVNSLKKGRYLNIPILSDIKTLSPIQAMRNLRRHNKRWHAAGKKITTSSRLIIKLRHRLLQEQLKTKQLRLQLKKINAIKQPSRVTKNVIDKNLIKLQELQNLIQEKDTHIRKLRNMLAVASETIKRQLTDNEQLFNKLQQINPEAINELIANNKENFRLELTNLEDNKHLSSFPSPSKTTSLPFQISFEDTNDPPYILLIILMIALFVLALLWRVFNQQQAKHRLENSKS